MEKLGISYFTYHVSLSGFEFRAKNGELTPKFILYLKGINADKLLLGKTKYKVIERVKTKTKNE